MASTLTQLIALVSDHLGDLETGTLTAGTSTTSMADSTRGDPDGHWIGGNLAFSSGALIGQEKRVNNWVETGGVFTTHAFSGTPAVGVSYELRKEPKHTRSRIKKFLNEAIHLVRDAYWVELDSRDDLSETTEYDQDVHEYSANSSLIYVSKVLWQDPNYSAGPPIVGDGTWYPLMPNQWWVNREGKIVLEQVVPDEAPLRIVGHRRPTELSAETDTIQVPETFPVFHAAKMMALLMAKGNPDEDSWLQKYSVFNELASNSRLQERIALPANARKVR